MPVKAKNYKALTGQGQGEAKNYTLAEMGDLCNDNLLTNSDFKSGIINSGGYPTYGGSIGHVKAYTIDMWFIQSANVNTAQVLVNSNSITIKNTNTSNDVIFGQSLERIFPSGDYCYFVRVKSVTGTVNAFMTNYEKLTKLVVGDNFVKETGQVGAFGLQLKPNSTIEIEYIKVEKGSYFTGMPAWSMFDEVDKCNRSYKMIKAKSQGDLIAIVPTDNEGLFQIPMDISGMRKRPSVHIKDIWTNSGGVYAQASTHSVYDDSILFKCDTKNATVQVYFDSTEAYIVADSYDY